MNDFGRRPRCVQWLFPLPSPPPIAIGTSTIITDFEMAWRWKWPPISAEFSSLAAPSLGSESASHYC